MYNPMFRSMVQSAGLRVAPPFLDLESDNNWFLVKTGWSSMMIKPTGQCCRRSMMTMSSFCRSGGLEGTASGTRPACLPAQGHFRKTRHPSAALSTPLAYHVRQSQIRVCFESHLNN